MSSRVSSPKTSRMSLTVRVWEVSAADSNEWFSGLTSGFSECVFCVWAGVSVKDLKLSHH